MIEKIMTQSFFPIGCLQTRQKAMSGESPQSWSALPIQEMNYGCTNTFGFGEGKGLNKIFNTFPICQDIDY